MSQLLNQITEDYKAALKSGDATRKTTISGVRAAIKNAEIENRGTDATMDDERILAIIQKEAKKRRESIEEYDKANRTDLSDQERAELEVLEAYLPQQMDDEELQILVRQAVEEVGASSPKDMGRVMGALLPKIGGRADGKRVSALVKANLA